MLVDHSKTHFLCRSCGTLVARKAPFSCDSDISDDKTGFYGMGYWLEYQTKTLDLPDIYERSIQDLPDRCVYWLKNIMQYKPPPARLLEVGCGHGAAVALTSWAGYESYGVELSDFVKEYAIRTFGIEVLKGPIKNCEFDSYSFDVLCAYDVFEHLLDPIGELNHWAKLLKQDGVIVLQTPRATRFDKQKSQIQLTRNYNSIFSDIGHTYIFTKDGMSKILSDRGFSNITFLKPRFEHDMYLIASRRKIEPSPAEAVHKALLKTPSGRLVKGMLDLYDKAEIINQSYRQSKSIRLLSLMIEGKWSDIVSAVRRRCIAVLKLINMIWSTIFIQVVS
jgi:SAM-dependent methyltransferase